MKTIDNCFAPLHLSALLVSLFNKIKHTLFFGATRPWKRWMLTRTSERCVLHLH